MVTQKPRAASGNQVPLWFLFAVMSMTLLTAIGFLYLGRVLAPGANLPADELKILSRAYERIDQHYIYNLSEKRRAELLHAAIGGLVNDLDQYSRYYPPQEKAAYDVGTRGVMTGIGVVVQTVRDQPDETTGPAPEKEGKQRVVVLYPSPGGPAEAAGMKVGDVITAVDGKPVATSTAAVEEIRGELETKTTLTIQRGDGDPFELKVARGSVIIPSIKWARILDADRGIGYLFLEKFTENCAAELDLTIQHLDRVLGRRLEGLVIDLRQNPGGLLDTCLEFTNYFLEEGTIVTLRRRNTPDKVHAATREKCKRPNLALALILDGSSASASEVLAGALQDHGRARLIGTRSYGKGVVQSVFSWTNRKEKVKITTSYYLTPNGRNIENSLRPESEKGKGGIAPDVESKFATAEARRHAVRLLRGREVPRKYRKEVDTLCKTRGYRKVSQPLDPDHDVQLESALEEVRSILRGNQPPHPKGK